MRVGVFMTEGKAIDNRVIIKDDINFLAYPNWVVSKRDFPNHFAIEQDNGSYEIKSAEGLPVKFDKIVLYYLLHKLSKEVNLNSDEITTTRYDIAKNVFSQSKNFSQAKYDRIMLALQRWKGIIIKFDGLFYEDENHSVKYFAVIDIVSLDKKTNKLFIKFNPVYIRQLKESKTYKYIDFTEYKKLSRPVSARLYEILIKKFLYEDIWCIDIYQLGEELTLGKRSYPSQVLVALEPAIEEVNLHSSMKCEFSYNKSDDICIFKKI